jgi:Fe-S-cluster containining protein
MMFECRLDCGACCIAPSITLFIPGMPNGKKAGVRCVQLDDKNLCKIFDKPERPALCDAFKADLETCGTTYQEALVNLIHLELITS